MGNSPAGLTEAQARERLVQQGPNALPPPRGSGMLAQVWRQLVTEPMFLLLLAAAGLYLALGSRGEGMLLGAFAVATVLLVLVQNQRSRRALDALRALAAPQARVLRDGRARRCPAAEVVPGDWLLLEEGERIAADAVVHESHLISVDESLLTGETVPVDKPPGATLAGGTLVVGGHGMAEVTATGVRSQAGLIGAMLDQVEESPTRLQQHTARLVRGVGAVAALVSVLIVIVMVAQGTGWLQALLAALALAMALLPEEFALAMTVFFVIGAWRLAQQKVLVRRSAVVETLGAATVLAVDKTGTLTENRMTLRCVVAEGDEAPWRCGGATPPSAATQETLRVARRAAREHTPDPLDRALRAGLVAEPRASLVDEHPVAPGQPYYVAVWSEDGKTEAACKGAAETVLALCSGAEEEARSRWAQRAAELASQGLRVLGVARATLPTGASPPRQPQGWRFEWCGLVAFEDPLRPSVPDAVRLARGAGVEVLMITGDAPGTALAIARQAGIDGAAGTLIGPQIDAMSDAELAEAVRRVRVFARVTPAHKLRLVRALQANQHVVAMTGDGVNDAPALRAANVGISMGERGTDVAREAAALVLMDDDFGRIVQAVSQGRRIFDNLRKVMLYIVAIHVPIAGLALLPLLLGWPALLLPAHVALTELVIDPMCTLGYEPLPAEREHMRRKPRAQDESLIGRAQLALGLAQGLTLLAVCVFVYGMALIHLEEPAARFTAFAALTSGNLVLALVNASQAPIGRGGLTSPLVFAWIAAIAFAALGTSVALPTLAGLFAFAWPGAGPVAAAVLLGALAVWGWDRLKCSAWVRQALGAGHRSPHASASGGAG
jgi:P-type Ca2+ transporter type 2C